MANVYRSIEYVYLRNSQCRGTSAKNKCLISDPCSTESTSNVTRHRTTKSFISPVKTRPCDRISIVYLYKFVAGGCRCSDVMCITRVIKTICTGSGSNGGIGVG